MRTGLIWAGVLVLAFTGSAVAGPVGRTRLAQASAREQAEAKKKEGDGLFRVKKFKEAEAAYDEAIKLDKGWYKAYEALGNLQFSSKRYAAAIESFMKAVEVEPRYHTGLYNIAFAYRKAGNYAKAVEYYQKYIKQKPGDPDAYYGLAASFEAKGDKKGAIDAYLKYADMEKRPSEKKYVLKARDKADALRKELGVAAAPAPKPEPKPVSKPEPKPAATPETKPAPKPAAVAKAEPAPAAGQSAKVAAWIADGDRAMAAEKYTKAMKLYFDAARAEPLNTEAVYKLGVVYEKTGNVRAAELKWHTVLKIDPDYAPAKQALARLTKPAAKAEPVAKAEPKPAPKPSPKSEPKPAPVAKVEPKPAPEPAVKARPAPEPEAMLSADQRKAQAKVQEGDAYFKRKSFAKAIAAYTHATQLSPKNEEALFKLATAYAYAGNLKVAIFKWKQVLKLNPNHAAAKRNIERAEAKLSGKPSGAKAAPAAAAKPAVKAASAPKPEGQKPVAKADSFESWAAAAAAAKKRGDAPGVLEATDHALQIKKDASMAILRGEALVILKRYGEAKKVFSRAMVLDPNLAAPFYGLGEACRMTGEKDRARYYFKMYIRSKAKDVKPALVQKAQAYLK